MITLSKTISRMQANKEKGFTLIELMIVVAILGILAAIAIPNFMRFQAKSKQSEAKTNLGAIGTTAESWRSENDTYEATFDDLGWAPQGTTRYDYGYNGDVLDAANGVTYGPEVVATDAATDADSFVAAAEGDIDSETTGQDCWTYNEARVLDNPANDVSSDAAAACGT